MTCIFRSLDLASSVSASAVFLTAFFISIFIYAFQSNVHLSKIRERLVSLCPVKIWTWSSLAIHLFSLFKPAWKGLFPKHLLFVDSDSSVVKFPVLSRQGDGCRIEAQDRYLFIPSVLMFSRLSIISRSRARCKFVADFYILLISLFTVTSIFWSLDLASSVSASTVVWQLSLFLCSIVLFSLMCIFLRSVRG